MNINTTIKIMVLSGLIVSSLIGMDCPIPGHPTSFIAMMHKRGFNYEEYRNRIDAGCGSIEDGETSPLSVADEVGISSKKLKKIKFNLDNVTDSVVTVAGREVDPSSVKDLKTVVQLNHLNQKPKSILKNSVTDVTPSYIPAPTDADIYKWKRDGFPSEELLHAYVNNKQQEISAYRAKHVEPKGWVANILHILNSFSK